MTADRIQIFSKKKEATIEEVITAFRHHKKRFVELVAKYHSAIYVLYSDTRLKIYLTDIANKLEYSLELIFRDDSSIVLKEKVDLLFTRLIIDEEAVNEFRKAAREIIAQAINYAIEHIQ